MYWIWNAIFGEVSISNGVFLYATEFLMKGENMYREKISTKLIWGVTLIVLILAVGFPYQIVMSEELIPDNQNKVVDTSDSIQTDEEGMETPKELSEEEFQKEIDELDKLSEGHVVLYDLEDPEGIDPNLLPADIAALGDEGTKVVAYKETTRPNSIQPSKDSEMFDSFNQYLILGIPCASPDGTRDTTTSTNFGEVTQYSRVYALRYDNAPWNPSQPLTGWEFEKQWSKWTRADTAWYVAEARMKLEAPQTQDYCTGDGLGALNYSSTSFDPGWISETATNWFSISGFSDIAYVPSPYHVIAYTQADIYQGYELKYNDAKTRQYFSKSP